MKHFVRNRHTTDAGTDSQVSPQADTDQTRATDRRWEIQRSRIGNLTQYSFLVT